MKQKIVFPTLVANLAIQSGKSKKQCEDFLRELFSIVEKSLSEGESVRIKGLGTFKLIDVDPRKSVDVNTGEDIEIPGHKKVTFIPAKELAEKINEPFAMFDSVEIPEPDSSTETDTEDNTEINNDSETSEEPEVSECTTDPDNNESPDTQESSDNQDSYDEIPPYEPTKKFRFLWGFVSGVFFTLIILVSVFFLTGGNLKDLLNNGTAKNRVHVTSQTDTIPETSEQDSTLKYKPEDTTNLETNTEFENSVSTAPSDNPVYDTISRTRYLTTMAKEHYGNYNLWPYIYLENQKILGHPDRIKPGTRVIVPNLSKYGVTPSNPEDIKIAKKKGIEIYAKFQ